MIDGNKKNKVIMAGAVCCISIVTIVIIFGVFSGGSQESSASPIVVSPSSVSGGSDIDTIYTYHNSKSGVSYRTTKEDSGYTYDS